MTIRKTDEALFVSLAALVGCLSACGEGVEGDKPNEVVPKVTFAACPAYISGAYADFSCAAVDMPLRHEEPSGRAISVQVIRASGKASAKKGQVWFLAGGPGDSAVMFVPFFDQFAKDHPEWDFYSVEHRGVGNSTRLSCPQESVTPMDFAGCAASLKAEWGDDIKAFSTTNAAEDVGTLIGALRPKHGRVFLYGVSYGTAWVQRYLQIYPHQVDGIIMDSLCMPGHSYIDFYDAQFNAVGIELLKACEDEPACQARLNDLGPTPAKALAALYAKIDSGSLCPPLAEMFDRTALRTSLAALERDWSLRTLIPALIYRMGRCSDADLSAFAHLSSAMSPSSESTGPDALVADRTLGNLIIASEAWGHVPADELLAADQGFLFSPDMSSAFASMLASSDWPTYGDDGYVNRWAVTQVPMLMMQGDRDPQAAWADALSAKEHFNAPNQTFVTVPGSPHAVIVSSFTQDSVAAKLQGDQAYWTKTCGSQLVWSFVESAGQALDTSCLSSLVPVSFAADLPINQAISSELLGTPDAWEGTPTE